MASTKRGLQLSDEPRLKKARVPQSELSQSAGTSNLRVVLNPADCDIDFNVEENGLKGSALYEEGFAYCWSGARANIGIRGGKYCFGCKIVSTQPADMEDTPPDLRHVCRVGISRGDVATRNLGETSNSFGYGGTGKFSDSGSFSDYGEIFGVGDTITCAVDLDNCPMASIGFSKNGKWLGVAKHVDAGPRGLGIVHSPIKTLQWESALFPHVLLKNVSVQLQFSIGDGLIPQVGYKPWNFAILDGMSVLGPDFMNLKDCEVIMMVGLPASGKTTWAEKWMKEHPEKRYVLLGTNLALEQMKVPDLLRKHNYHERFGRLMGHATKIFNALLSRASRIPRNFIIDQTNVYKSARKRKLKPFSDYIKIALVVFPRAEELKIRADKRFKEMGKEVPAAEVNKMIANYTLPMSKDMPWTDEYFDQVVFVELSGAEAQRSLDEMKRELNSVKTPMQADAGLSYQNQGVGDHYQSLYPSLPQTRASHGSHYSSPYGSDPRHGFGYMGSSNGYGYARTPSLLQYSGSDRFANESGGALSDPAMTHPLYHSARPIPFGFHLDVQRVGVHPQPPPPPIPTSSLNFPVDVEHPWVHPQPPPPPIPLSSLNFPMDVERPGLHPQPSVPWPVNLLSPSAPFPTDVQHVGVHRQPPPPPGGY